MAKINFTASNVENFECPKGKLQAFMWDSSAPGLGLRANPGGRKSYIFQSKHNGKTLRVTIGVPKLKGKGIWLLDDAQKKARELQATLDKGQDPRVVAADARAAEQAEREAAAAAIEAARVADEQARRAAAAAELRESVTLAKVWPDYIADRIATADGGWSKHHIAAHHKLIQKGGEKRPRRKKETTAGPLASLADERLIDITASRVEEWAREEVKTRPSSARLALRLLKAFLRWCGENPEYADIAHPNAAMSKRAREVLGSEKKRHDVLEREQLAVWFDSVRKIENRIISAYLQTLLLTGCRREELAELKWKDLNFEWNSIKLRDKVEDFRMIPLTPYVHHLLSHLPRRNEYVFSSTGSKSGHIVEPRIAHNEALQVAGLPPLTLHGLRRSFATLCEWIECPSGVSAQIQGHAPQGVREQNYIRRPLDQLRKWHIQIEAWFLEQARVTYTPAPAGRVNLRVVAS